MNELRVTVGGQSHEFRPDDVVRIGRSPESSVVIDDPTVSRQHGRLTWGPSGWIFSEIAQGRTFLHGQSVTQLVISGPTELSLASPNGPSVWVEPVGVVDPYGMGHPGGQAGWGNGRIPRVPAASKDELVAELQILIPIKSWLKNPGWRQGISGLVIPYALLPLIFEILFANTANPQTPGWAYSLYIAPLWLLAFWLIIRPGPFKKLELTISVAVIAWLVIWMQIATAPIDGHIGEPNSLIAGLGVGFNEEISKALPILLVALYLLKYRSTKLSVKMWMFLGTISGLTFGVVEASQIYTAKAILVINSHPGDVIAGILQFTERVFVDGFEHAIWAGIAAFFIGLGINYRKQRLQLFAIGISLPAILHGLNDWCSSFSSPWPCVGIQALSLFFFLGYAMSAHTIEQRVRRSPIFRGESIALDPLSDPMSDAQR